MKQEALFHADSVICDIHSASKKQLFQEMGAALLDTKGLKDKALDLREIVAATMERERLGSTGVGNGVALPHARIEGIEKVHAIFARLDAPIDYDAIDERPVDLVVMLLAPFDAGGAHLRALAQVSRRLRRQDMRHRLRAAPSAESLLTILTEDFAANAA